MKPRVAVIGAGVAGLSVAAAAAQRFDVTVLEAETQPGYHTSGRSAAVWIEPYEGAIVRELTRASRSYHEGLGAKPIGCITVADEAHADQALRFYAEWRALCPKLREIAPEALLRRVPILRPAAVHTVIEDPETLSLDAHGLLMSFRKRLVEHGGVLHTGCRIESAERRGAAWRLTGADRTFEAELVVDAAGAWADEVAVRAGVVPLGITPRRRTALLVDPGVPHRDWPLVHRAEGGLYFKPEGGALMVSLGDETPSDPCDARPDELDVAMAVERFETMTSVAVKRLQHTWAGLRTFARDRRPVVGFDSRAEGFFWLAGHGGFGMQTAPALGELAARLLAGDDHPLAAALAPARFAD